MPNYVMPDSCFDDTSLCLIPLYPIPLYLIPLSHVMPNSVVPGSPRPFNPHVHGQGGDQKPKKASTYKGSAEGGRFDSLPQSCRMRKKRSGRLRKSPYGTYWSHPLLESHLKFTVCVKNARPKGTLRILVKESWTGFCVEKAAPPTELQSLKMRNSGQLCSSLLQEMTYP